MGNCNACHAIAGRISHLVAGRINHAIHRAAAFSDAKLEDYASCRRQ
jgi:hypothetical protein